jgi:hypothetical protein
VQFCYLFTNPTEEERIMSYARILEVWDSREAVMQEIIPPAAQEAVRDYLLAEESTAFSEDTEIWTVCHQEGPDGRIHAVVLEDGGGRRYQVVLRIGGIARVRRLRD